MADYEAIVIGAGCGGLSVGAQLARQGRRVLVLEQSERVGGCCSTFERDGFRFDLGASIVESVDVLELAFRRLGTTLKEEVDLVSCDPTYTVRLKDGGQVKFPLSIDDTAREIGRIAPEDVAGWYAFVRYMQSFRAALGDFFTTPAGTLSEMAHIFVRSPRLLTYGPLFVSSYQDVLQKFFQNPRTREALSYQTLFIGLPPELGPGMFAIIPCTEHEGLFYCRGGMIGIPAALQRCGEKQGMEVRLNTRVTRVLVSGGRAIGVRLADGTELTADVVVSDINAKTLYLDLIGAEHLPWLARLGLQSYEYAMAVPMLYLGVDYTPPLESHHTLVTLPVEELNEFWWNTYRQNRYPAEQFGIISWTSGTDPGLAPTGQHVIILTLAPGPYRLAGATWDEVKPGLTESIIGYFSEKHIPGLAEHVRVAELATPLDFERRLLLPEGAIYALRQDLTSEMAFRPSARSKSIRGLYLVGASTHPGGGVPTTIASGLIAADLIEKYEPGRSQ
jgi:phytoene desaturase